MGEGLIANVLPDKLFRYRRLDTIYASEEINRAISNRQVFMARATSLNDPFDFSPIYSKDDLKNVLAAIKRAGKNSRVSVDSINEMADQSIPRGAARQLSKATRPSVDLARLYSSIAERIVTRLKNKAVVACFSERNDSIPMWAHDTGHTGYCLEYKFHHQTNFIGPSRFPLKVLYHADRPIITTIDIGKFSGKFLSATETQGDAELKVFDAMYFSKAEDWSYEREWRVFETESKFVGYQEVSSLEVTKILLGVNISSDEIHLVQGAVGGRVPLYRATLSSSNYSVSFKKLA